MGGGHCRRLRGRDPRRHDPQRREHTGLLVEVPAHPARALLAVLRLEAHRSGAWVVGEDDTGLKVLHHDGSGWSAQSVPDGVVFLMGITARTATDAWAWADTTTGTTVLHWDGTAWRDAKVPLPPDSSR